MTATLTIGITGFAFRACEAPLTLRQRILGVTSEVTKVVLAVLILPFVYFVAWFMTLLCATLALVMVRTERAAIRKHQDKAASYGAQDFEGIRRQLSQIRKLTTIDRTLRPLSPTYNWLLAGFDNDLREFASDYEGMLESARQNDGNVPLESSDVADILVTMDPTHRSLREKAREEMSEFEREHHW